MLGVVWLLSVGAGLAVLLNYANAPGVAATPPPRWPEQSRIERSPDRATLVLFVHPHCPCSRASVEELDRVMARSEGSLSAHVLFLKPAGVAEDWEKTTLWRSAAAIRGVSLSTDDDGAETRRFGSATSGQTMLYDADGRLLFSGGITSARGHSGDNPGRTAILALLAHRSPVRNRTPVFGCALSDPQTSGSGWSISDAF